MCKLCKGNTAFACRFGKIKFDVMPFGLMNDPSTFHWLMDRILKCFEFVRVYLDDVVIFSTNEEEHMKHLRIVIERIAGAHLKLKIKKCLLGNEA